MKSKARSHSPGLAGAGHKDVCGARIRTLVQTLGLTLHSDPKLTKSMIKNITDRSADTIMPLVAKHSRTTTNRIPMRSRQHVTTKSLLTPFGSTNRSLVKRNIHNRHAQPAFCGESPGQENVETRTFPNSIRLASYAENATQGEGNKEEEEADHSKGAEAKEGAESEARYPSQPSSTIRTRWRLRRGGRSPSINYTPARSPLRRCTKPTLGVRKVAPSVRSQG